MAELYVVNPGKKKKRRGGKKRATRPKAKTRTITKTRVVTRNPKKKRSGSRRRYHRNPGFNLFGNMNVMDIAGGTGIGIMSRLLPGILNKYGLPIPTTSWTGYLSQFGSGLAISYVFDKFLKMRGIAQKGMEITTALVLTRAVNELVLGSSGLSKLRGIRKKGPYVAGLKRIAGKGVGRLHTGIYETANSTGNSTTSRVAPRYGNSQQLSRF